MLEYEVVWVRLPPACNPVSQQRRFPSARLTQHGQAASQGTITGKGIKPIEISIASHIELGAPAFSIGLMVAVFTCPYIRHLVCREFGVNGCGEVGQNELRKSTGVGIVFAQGNVFDLANRFHLLLKCRLTIGFIIVLRQMIATTILRVFRIAEVEERASGHVWVVEHTMEGFQFGDAAFGHLAFQPVLLIEQGRRIRLRTRHPAIAFTQQTDEEWATALDLCQTVAQCLLALRLFLGDTPAQINFDKLHRSLAADLPQGWPDVGHEFVAVLNHVAKRRRNKHADDAVFGGGRCGDVGGW